MKLPTITECQFSVICGNVKQLTMIVEEQGKGFWTWVRLPSSPLEESYTNFYFFLCGFAITRILYED